MKEVWKKVKLKHFNHYKVSNYGRVVNTKTNKYLAGLLIPSKIRGNFIQIHFHNKEHSKTIFLHILVFKHFKPNELKHYVWHNDYNGLNNKENNLSELTRGDIYRKGYELKKQKRGVYKWTVGNSEYFRAALKVKDKVVTLGYTNKKKDAEILYEFGYKFIYGSLPF